jgi:hypothetical protein
MSTSRHRFTHGVPADVLCRSTPKLDGLRNRSQPDLRRVIMQRPRVSHRVVRTAWASVAAATLACTIGSCSSVAPLTAPNAGTEVSAEATSSPSNTGAATSAEPTSPTTTSTVQPGPSATPLSVDPKKPMLILRLVPQGGSCADEGIQIPAVTMYRDGSVLMSDDGGFYCAPLPRITTGQIDPTWAKAELARYFASAASRSNMTTLDGGVGVADGITTDLTFTSIDGIDPHTAAYVLDMTNLGLSPDKTASRSQLRSVLDQMRQHIVKGASWTPDSLRIIKAPGWVPQVKGQSIWPIAVSHEVQLVIAGRGGSCTILTGSEAMALRRAQGSRPAMTTWLINGKRQHLAVGVVIPGLVQDCSVK